MLLSFLAQLPPLDPAVIAKQDTTELLAIICVVLMAVIGMREREIVRLRIKYDALLEHSLEAITANTARLTALEEELEIYPALQRLEVKLGDAPNVSGRSVRK